MNVGLPGTGIGGLFYLLTAIIILLNEMYLTLRRRSSMKRWKIILEQSWITFSMIAVAIIINILLSTYILKKHSSFVPSSKNTIIVGAYFLQAHPILVPIILLAGVLMTVQILSLLITIKLKHAKKL